MPPVPFKMPARLPRLLTVEETADLFGVSAAPIVKAARRVLERKRTQRRAAPKLVTNGSRRSGTIMPRKGQPRSGRKHA